MSESWNYSGVTVSRPYSGVRILSLLTAAKLPVAEVLDMVAREDEGVEHLELREHGGLGERAAVEVELSHHELRRLEPRERVQVVADHARL